MSKVGKFSSAMTFFGSFPAVQRRWPRHQPACRKPRHRSAPSLRPVARPADGEIGAAKIVGHRQQGASALVGRAQHRDIAQAGDGAVARGGVGWRGFMALRRQACRSPDYSLPCPSRPRAGDGGSTCVVSRARRMPLRSGRVGYRSSTSAFTAEAQSARGLDARAPAKVLRRRPPRSSAPILRTRRQAMRRGAARPNISTWRSASRRCGAGRRPTFLDLARGISPVDDAEGCRAGLVGCSASSLSVDRCRR